MTMENAIRMIAGSMVLLSLVLYYFISPYWLFLAGFVGLNLMQSAVTRFCPAEMIMGKLFYDGKTESCCGSSKNN